VRHPEIPGTALTGAQAAFRAQVREFLASGPVTASVQRLRRHGEEAGALDVYRWLGERGWLAPSWPAEFGGLGRGEVEAAIVTEEMALAGVPDDVHVLGVDIVGRFLLGVGTPEQQKRLLPPIARGECVAAVLFTEPDGGSDLARLTSRAEPDGDGWRLSGTKIYSQKSQFADVALAAVRTADGPVPFDGITLFLVPMRSAGVSLRPVPNLTNDLFFEVTIDGLRLGPEDVVGEVGDGWRLLNEMLVLERTGIDFHGKIRRWLDAAAADAGRFADPLFAARWAELDARLSAGHALAWRIVADLERGRVDPSTAAMAKWYVTEQARDVAQFCLGAHGADGALDAGDPGSPDLGLAGTAARHAPTYRLASGTSEVMLYIVASTELGLL
jgi:alkylation response protein AidB-like acyl-CoA dehydrogenase